MTEETTTGNTTETTTSGAETTGGQLDYKKLYTQALHDATEWQKRFTGLQGTYQRDQQKWKDDSEALVGLKTTIDTLTAEKADLQSQLQTTEEKLGMTESEKEIQTANLERMEIVIKEFPHLAPLLAKGLLPDDTGEELRTKLSALTETIGGLQTSAVESYKSGGSPSQPPKPKPAGDKNSLQTQLVEAWKAGNSAEYNRLYDEILKLGGPNG